MPPLKKVEEQMKKNLFILLVFVLVLYTSTLFSRQFDFEKDKILALDFVSISKTVEGVETETIQFYLFTLELLQEKGITLLNHPPDSFGFIIPEIINLDYFKTHSKDSFILEYDYTPIIGLLKDKQEKVESFVYFQHNREDFGGRSYCADCGEPMAYGTRFIKISDTEPIWLRNQWLDFSRSFYLDLRWICEQERLEFKIQK